MFVGSSIDVDDDDVADSDAGDANIAVDDVTSSPDFFFLLRPSDDVPVWIRGDGVDFGDTTIVCVDADGLKQEWIIDQCWDTLSSSLTRIENVLRLSMELIFAVDFM